MVNKSYKSFKEINLSKFLIDLEKEWNNQDNKFPNQTHSLEKWIVIIMEEIGEISKEVLDIESNDFDFYKLHKELIQSITLLIRLRYSIYTWNLDNKIFI